jgi:hypothetical protein
MVAFDLRIELYIRAIHRMALIPAPPANIVLSRNALSYRDGL